MENKKTSVFSNGMIWFGAGVSIAEIITGTYLSPLGMGRGFIAILLGHIIGCILLFFAGYIGAKTEKSAMETAKLSFGKKGSILFAACNVLQLVGWTGIMIYDGALSACGIFQIPRWIWCVVIGVLILAWIFIGINQLDQVNTVAMALLFLLTLVLSVIIFREKTVTGGGIGETITFGAAVELSVAMPLSWFPVISDYTRKAEKPFSATLTSAVVYGVISTWMFVIGMAASIFTGESDICNILLKAGLGVVGLLIVVFSTVTTTFLDAFSAGVSSVSISDKINEKWAAVAATVIGTVAACVYPMDNITNFLYVIGSVFAPMIAIQIVDYYILHHDQSSKNVNGINIGIWVVGFVAYRLLMRVDTPIGNTLPDMIFVMILTYVVWKIHDQLSKKNR